MDNKRKSIGIVGFPGLYGGAGVELDHQMTLWKEMGYELHLIPTGNPLAEPLYKKTVERAVIHIPDNYSVFKDMPVISFCNDIFLRDIDKIKKFASQTIFVNCMTWLFPAEKEAHKKGLIDLFLYQSQHTLDKVAPSLREINEKFNVKVFNSWFDYSRFPFYKDRPTDKFRFGRISREDADKYAKESMWIYETMVAPVPKSGIFLGFDSRSEGKIGKPPDWVRAYPGNGISQQEFYAHCSCIIQKSDTYENWPRVGFESMASGSVLIVDDKGGWKSMVEHGRTGWLCKDQREFVYYSSRMAYEAEEREQMALAAREKLNEINNREKSIQSWREIFG